MLRAASVVVLAAASLAGGRSIIEHSDAVRRRLSEPPDGCSLYLAGPIVASSGNQVATVDSLQNYELSFTMELDGDWTPGGDWHTILHIGDTNSHRLPAIWFPPSQNGITPAQSHSDCSYSLCDWGLTTTGVTFSAGGTYEIKMVVQNNQMTVYVDGVSVGEGAGWSIFRF